MKPHSPYSEAHLLRPLFDLCLMRRSRGDRAEEVRALEVSIRRSCLGDALNLRFVRRERLDSGASRRLSTR